MENTNKKYDSITEKTLNDTKFLRIEHYSGHPEVAKAAELLVNHSTALAGKRRLNKRSSWISAAKKLIASLWIREEDMFRFGTKKDYFSGKNRKQVWLTAKTLELFKAAQSLGWLTKVVDAIPPAYAKKARGGHAAIYCRQQRFKELLLSLQLEDVEVDDDLPWVTLKDHDDNLLPLPSGYIKSDGYKTTLETLRQHYALLCTSSIKNAEGEPVQDITYRYTRKWKGDTGTGGRFYAPFCNWSKEERLSITVDGEPVGSWDFSQLHPTLLLLLVNGTGKETNLFSTDDVYAMPDYPNLPRKAHKKFINTILNAETRQAAIKSIATAHYYWNLIDDCWVYETYSGAQKRSGWPVWSDKPQKAAEEYVDAFLFRHPNFQNLAFKGMWGMLQLIDSSVIEEAVRRATCKGVPVLPVHDELVVPASKQMFTKKILVDSFHDVTRGRYEGFEPPLGWSYGISPKRAR